MEKTTAAAAVASSSSPLQSEPKYKGVRKRKWGKWVAEIRLPNSRERIWLGSHESPEKAARAFDAALYCLRGGGGGGGGGRGVVRFNFPDTPLVLGGGGGERQKKSASTQQEIQAVAAKFASEGAAGFSHGSTVYGESSSSTAAVMEEECDYTSSSTVSGAAQGGVKSDAAMDWSFLNTLEDHGDCFWMCHPMDGGYYPPPPLPTSDVDGHDGDGDAYSHPESLWDWNF